MAIKFVFRALWLARLKIFFIPFQLLAPFIRFDLKSTIFVLLERERKNSKMWSIFEICKIWICLKRNLWSSSNSIIEKKRICQKISANSYPMQFYKICTNDFVPRIWWWIFLCFEKCSYQRYYLLFKMTQNHLQNLLNLSISETILYL